MGTSGDKIIKWGIIGCGDVTEVKSGPAYSLTEGFALNAVMRRHLDKAEDYAKRHQVPKFYGDADRLIQDKEVDAIYIATPPDTHGFYALKVAAAGKPCCIEKPMSPSYKESLEIFNAFKKHNLPLFVAYYRRSLPKFNKIKTWIQEGKIGKIRTVHWTLSKPASAVDLSGGYNWRTDKKFAPGGYFDDLASHGLDLFTHYLGDITEATGYANNRLGLYTAVDGVVGSWKHNSGMLGSGIWNFGAYKKEDKVILNGDQGLIEFSIFEDDPIILDTIKGRKEISIAHPKHVQLPHVELMRDHLFNEDFSHPSTGKSALHTSWVMDKILGKF